MFFLLRAGQGGYSKTDVDGMTHEEMGWHVNRLVKQLGDEKAAREGAQRDARLSSKAQRR